MDDEQRSAKTDEASDHEYDNEDESCCDVFPFMQLPDDMRARALEYLLSASEACHDPWASAKRVPYSAAASLDTLLFHAGHQNRVQSHRQDRTAHGTKDYDADRVAQRPVGDYQS